MNYADFASGVLVFGYVALLANFPNSVHAEDPVGESTIQLGTEKHWETYGNIACLAFSPEGGGYAFTAHDKDFNGGRKYAHQIILVDIGNSPVLQFTVFEGQSDIHLESMGSTPDTDTQLFKKNCNRLIGEFSEEMLQGYLNYVYYPGK